MCVSLGCVALTYYVQGVGVVDGSVLVLHHAGVVALVRRHHALHDQGPVLAAHLDEKRHERLRASNNIEADDKLIPLLLQID